MAAPLSKRDLRILAASLRFNPEEALGMLLENPDACLPQIVRIADQDPPDDAARIVLVLQEFSARANTVAMDLQILQCIPHGSPHLTGFATDLAKGIAARLAADATATGAMIRAEVLSELSERCEAGGDPLNGLAASMESVRLFRDLSAKDAQVLPKLVAALKCLAKRCSSARDHAAAIRAATEAVEIAISIADDLTGARRVIDALDVLANRQSIAGERELALTTTMRGVALLDSLGEHGEALIEERAMIRLRQSTLLTRLQRFEECLPIADEAVELFQGLAHQSPHAYAHLYLEAVDLAGGCRVRLGLPISGFLPRGEARAFFEPLVAADPRRHAPRLMRYLARESAMIEADGKSDEALRLVQQAVAMVATVSEHHENRHAMDQGHVFIHCAQLQLARGNMAAAVEAVHRAIERFGAAAETQPAATAWLDSARAFLGQISARREAP
jgi:tetratricopeptide (TPR) repeat protein